MAISRFTASGITTGNKKFASFDTGYPSLMSAPTAADGGTGTTASITFTTQPGATSYTALSTPGSITGTGTSSPLTVSGLTTGTAYTFQIRANNSVGNGPYSAESNSVTPAVPPAYELIASTLRNGGSTTTVTFNSIPQTYIALEIRCSFIPSSSSGYFPKITFNNATGATAYNNRKLYNYISNTRGWASLGNGSGMEPNPYNYAPVASRAATSNSLIVDYTSASKWPQLLGEWRYQDWNTAASGEITNSSSVYATATSVSSIEIAFGGIGQTNTYLALYGIKGQ